MTYAPLSIVTLGKLWVSHGGVNSGIVGDTAHLTKGTSYHLGKSQLRSDAYSIQLARDKAGLTEAASAIDLGKLGGSYAKLRTFSKWLVKQCQNKAPGTGDIREIIYSPDGREVWRWSGVDRKIHTGPGNGDNSHLWHTHISFYRDSEKRDKTVLFKPYWDQAVPVPPPVVPPPDTATGDAIVRSYTVPKVPSQAWAGKGVVLYTTDAMDPKDPNRIIIDPGRYMPYLGAPSSAVAIVEYVNASGVHSGKSYFVPTGKLTKIGAIPAPVDTTPYTKAQVNAAFNEGRDAAVNAAAATPRR